MLIPLNFLCITGSQCMPGKIKCWSSHTCGWLVAMFLISEASIVTFRVALKVLGNNQSNKNKYLVLSCLINWNKGTFLNCLKNRVWFTAHLSFTLVYLLASVELFQIYIDMSKRKMKAINLSPIHDYFNTCCSYV